VCFVADMNVFHLQAPCAPLGRRWQELGASARVPIILRLTLLSHRFPQPVHRMHRQRRLPRVGHRLQHGESSFQFQMPFMFWCHARTGIVPDCLMFSIAAAPPIQMQAARLPACGKWSRRNRYFSHSSVL